MEEILNFDTVFDRFETQMTSYFLVKTVVNSTPSYTKGDTKILKGVLTQLSPREISKDLIDYNGRGLFKLTIRARYGLLKIQSTVEKNGNSYYVIKKDNQNKLYGFHRYILVQQK